MKSVLRFTGALISTYLLSWTVAYLIAFLVRGEAMDVTYILEYLAQAWTFRGGELPVFIWMLSLIVFLPLAGWVVVQLRRSDGSRKSS